MTPQPVEPKPFHRPLRGLRVLVVDDNEDSREMLTFLLVVHGADAIGAEDAAEALDLLRAGSFDILLSDLNLPGEDGWSLVRKARALAPAMPAVALSALASPEDQRRSEAAGFLAHLTKPVEPHALVAKLLDAKSARAPG